MVVSQTAWVTEGVLHKNCVLTFFALCECAHSFVGSINGDQVCRLSSCTLLHGRIRSNGNQGAERELYYDTVALDGMRPGVCGALVETRRLQWL